MVSGGLLIGDKCVFEDVVTVDASNPVGKKNVKRWNLYRAFFNEAKVVHDLVFEPLAK